MSERIDLSEIEEKAKDGAGEPVDVGATFVSNDTLLALVRAVKAGVALEEAPHIGDFGEDHFAVEHPMSCPDLLACEWFQWGRDLGGPPESGLGRYTMGMEDGRLTLEPFEGESPRHAFRSALAPFREEKP